MQKWLLVYCLLFSIGIQAQNIHLPYASTQEDLPEWAQLMYAPEADLNAVQIAFEAYYKSFLLKDKKLSYATTRAGNVVGGGDMKKDRIVPDVIKSLKNRKPLIIRSPDATRPWQHVLEPISGYLRLGELLINKKLSTSLKPNWNFGPNPVNCKPVLHVVKEIITCWGEEKKINIIKSKKFKEAKLLMISNNKAKKELNWCPTLNFKETIKITVEWYKNCFYENKIEEITRKQIEYFSKK